MFERYTEKARRAIFFARYEASKFGSPLIESEFLLLGILREDPHVVTRWTGDRDWSSTLRDEFAKYLSFESTIPISQDLPLSDEAKRVLAYAAEEAHRLAHSHIGVEHLFLGLLRERNTRVGKLLRDRGVNENTVRETIARESAHSGIPGEGKASITQRRFFQIDIIVEESGQSLQLSWPSRIPAVGEILSLDREPGKSSTYQVVRVEWKVTSVAAEPPSLSKALIYVRWLKNPE
jgi:ATP-dependent Clp protease ATP-binding subunit ClpC